MKRTHHTTQTKPYLIRALFEWCNDNGLTPYISVWVDETVQVPRDYVSNAEIVLNISYDATSSLKLDNDFICFQARFGGIARDIIVPVDRVTAIYARENGQGMGFSLNVEKPAAESPKPTPAGLYIAAGANTATGHAAPPAEKNASKDHDDGPTTPDPKDPGTKKPALKRIK